MKPPTPLVDPPTHDEASPTPLGESASSERAYDATFWLCYAANCCMVMTYSLMFRYADFVAYLGGSEMHLGLIVGVGMIGALAMRVFQGIWIDRYGPRRVWLLSLILCSVSMLAHLGINRVDGIGVYVVRILFMTSLAGAFGASLTYISLRSPRNRMAEMIGILGTAGFVGIALGPILGDILFAGETIGRPQIVRLFSLAAAMSFASFVVVAVSTREPMRRALRKRPPLVGILRRYHPGVILLVGVAMGLAIALPHTFVRAYAAELAIPRITAFFLVYASVAMLVRIRTRRLPDQIGVRPLILWGLACAALALLSFLCVNSEWMLAIPAAFMGTAHAFLFPAVLAGCNAAFPNRYRGIATTLMLAMFDLGSLIGQPLVGGIVDGARCLGWPPYPTMFLTVAAAVVGIAVIYRRKTLRVSPCRQTADTAVAHR